jgi:hypothetical protein
VNFDTRDVTATTDGPNRGKLSFWLIKDQRDVRFSGYLFVFIEMVDERGDGKTYAYPEGAQLGEGDLPTDYRLGKSLTFKFNQQVELPYKDPRKGASLAHVSVLLYGEDGRIVFQRGFDRTELKVAGAKATRVEGVPAKPTKKRQAL